MESVGAHFSPGIAGVENTGSKQGPLMEGWGSAGIGEPDRLRISEYRSLSSLREVLPAWESILNANPKLTIFSTPEWLFSWWKAFGHDRQLLVLVFADLSERIVGIVPLYWENVKRSSLRFTRDFRFVGDGTMDSDGLDLIVRPGFESDCIAGFLRWMSDEPNGGICSFNTLPATSAAAAILKEELEAANWPVWETKTPNSSIPLPNCWEHYIHSLSPKFRRLIARSQRKVAHEHRVKLRRCEKPCELSEMLEILFDLHQKRWNSIQQPGTFSCAKRRQLYVEMARVFLSRGWLELWTLEFDGKAVASQMGFRYRDTVYGLQEGFDPAHAADHVGYVLRAGMLEQFIRAGVKHYDFLGGVSASKLRWGAEEGSYTNLAFAAPWTLGSCYLTVGKRAAASKEWLRHHLPKPAWNVLHRAKVGLLESAPVLQQRAPDSNVTSRAFGHAPQD